MKFTEIFLVIPTIRDLELFKVWGKEFEDCHLMIVEDRAQKTVRLPQSKYKSITHLDWADIKKDFGQDEWIFSRQNAGIRSYGFWKAWKAGAKAILTLDDDCYPVDKGFIRQHLQNLAFKSPVKWVNTYPDPRWMFTRGMPYENRNKIPVKVSHGLWSGALDLDGKTEVKLAALLREKPYPPIRQIVPFGYYYPMCSMNLAFHRDVTPLMFFPMMGSKPDVTSWEYDRYDDIWAGILSKKVMDHLAWGVIDGSPYVEHRKASKPTENKQKEIAGMEINEWLWQEVDRVVLTSKSVIGAYQELIDRVEFPNTVYFTALRKAVKIWLSYFG